MTIDKIHRFINLLKNQGQNGYIEPTEIDDCLNAASLDMFNEVKKLYEKSRVVSDAMRPFKNSSPVALTAGTGTLPTGYEMAIQVLSGDIEVDIVPDTEFSFLATSDLTPPTVEFPICRITTDIKVRPTSIASVTLEYFKKPAVMVWGYTTSSNRYIYNVGSSTQPDWPDSMHMELIKRACGYLGITLKDDILIQTERIKQAQ